MKKLNQLAAWQALENHYQAIHNGSLHEWFMKDPERFSRFSLSLNDMLFDFSKNRVTQETIPLLIKLAEEVHLSESIEALFSGAFVNFTEKRPALHIALRDRDCSNLIINGHNVMPDIHAELKKMHFFSDSVRDGTWRGATGQPIRDIVNIGIGGSHLGPLMVTHALRNEADEARQCYFISNVDGAALQDILKKIDPEKTLFIISSKSFTTIETVSNANLIRQWLQKRLDLTDVSSHFVAVTASFNKAKDWGIPETQIFSIWDWVGGRYSVWSAIGLPIALMIGMNKFYEFLDGAHAMDIHFRQTEFSKNIPVLLGLLGIWSINFFGCQQQAIVPYAHELNYFRDYIQQADMESNGKAITRSNVRVDYATGPVILGQQGCDSQHSFFQWLHQAPHFIPIDFILVGQGKYFQHEQDILIASALSQAQALMMGCSYEEVDELSKHKTIPGNRPSTVLFLKKITPFTLGMLTALYEHKIFVQGIIWNINSFDQWGVELGKQLLPMILTDLQNPETNHSYDSSTAGLIHYYRNIT